MIRLILLLAGAFSMSDLLAHGTLDEAIAKARQEAVDSGEVSAKLRLVALLIQHEEYEEAVEIAAACQAEEPDAHLLLARIAHRREDEKKALNHVGSFLESRPQSAEGYFFQAELLEGRDPAAAAESQEKAIALTGTATPDHYLFLSALLVSAQQSKQALTALEHALEDNPTHTGLAEERARLLYQEGQRQEAMSQLEALRQRQPALAFRYWTLEADLLKKDDAEASRRALQRALSSLESREESRALPPALEVVKGELQQRLESVSEK